MSKVPWSMIKNLSLLNFIQGQVKLQNPSLHNSGTTCQDQNNICLWPWHCNINCSFYTTPYSVRHVSFNKLYAWECLLYKWFLLFKPNWIRTREYIFSGRCIRNLRSKLISWWFILFMESYAPSTFENSREDKRSHIAWTSRLYSYKTKTVQKKHKHNNISLS